MIENPDKALKVNACLTKREVFPVKHEESQSASLWISCLYDRLVNLVFKLTIHSLKKKNFMPAQEVHICYCIYVWNSFENWHMVVELSVANTV